MNAKPKERGITFSTDLIPPILTGKKFQTRRVIKPQPSRWPALKDFKCSERGVTWTDGNYTWKFPYGRIGDRLWVRETWRIGAWDQDYDRVCIDYRAGDYSRKEWIEVPEGKFEQIWIDSSEEADRAGFKTDEDGMYHWKPGQSPCRWRSGRFMPRWASRIVLEVVDWDIERVQNISEDDARCEGVGSAPWWIPYGAKTEGEQRNVDGVEGVIKGGATYRNGFATKWDEINGKNGCYWVANPWVWVVKFRLLETA